MKNDFQMMLGYVSEHIFYNEYSFNNENNENFSHCQKSIEFVRLHFNLVTRGGSTISPDGRQPFICQIFGQKLHVNPPMTVVHFIYRERNGK